ncbi:oxidoreductase [Brevibacillus parabrevis]|uniref:NAD-dependent epimerase/dehydratase family protein n=1 Tax=Brevibacillus parabrevis TaxID=54914 RepID=UPI0007AB2B8F|nr:NAD(P)H-binding protein [Brevibacillus parabrevis]KZE51935.1 oxidoreductase [Brevibacillus parabrevis]
MKQKTALLLGASGLVGGQLLRILLEAREYERVTILVRRPLEVRHAKLNEVVVNFDRLADFVDKFQVDDVFSCLGTTIKKAKTREAMHRIDYGYSLEAARLAKQMGASQLLTVSSLGADPRSRVWYSRMKGELEQELQRVRLKSLHLFRPSLLLGQRDEVRQGESVFAWLMPKLSFLLTGSLRKYRAIEAGVVANAMYRAAQLGEEGTRIYLSDEIERMGRG